MSRQSSDELAPDGSILNGYDYNLQVWVRKGVVLQCYHPVPPPEQTTYCCNAARYVDKRVRDVLDHEVRETDSAITARLSREYQRNYKRNLTP